MTHFASALFRMPASNSCTRAIAAVLMWGIPPAGIRAQPVIDPPAITVTGGGPTTYVLISGIVGSIAGFRRLEAELTALGHRVVVVDPYALSLDSTDVSFAALARRVDRELARLGIDSARAVGHAHGGGVALRLAAQVPTRVTALYLLDVGALPQNRTEVFSGAMRFVPFITRLPGGRRFVRSRLINGIRDNAGRQEWFDVATQRAYADPMLDRIGRVVSMAGRLASAREPEPLDNVVARLRCPVTMIVGAIPRASGPDSVEFAALAPLGGMLRVEWLAGVGHFPHEEAPAEVARIIARAPVALRDYRIAASTLSSAA